MRDMTKTKAALEAHDAAHKESDRLLELATTDDEVAAAFAILEPAVLAVQTAFLEDTADINKGQTPDVVSVNFARHIVEKNS